MTLKPGDNNIENIVWFCDQIKLSNDGAKSSPSTR